MSEVVSVVAGGWSVSEVAVDRLPGMVIAVNDSFLSLPRVDMVVSMDRLWTENRWRHMVSAGVPAFIRWAALKRLDWQQKPWLHPFDCDHETVEFSDAADRLNGVNSAVCAINLAWRNPAPRELYLFGFDHQKGPKGEMYWYPEYDWGSGLKDAKLRQWSRLYEQIAVQLVAKHIRTFNVSSRTLVRGLQQVTPKEVGLAL